MRLDPSAIAAILAAVSGFIRPGRKRERLAKYAEIGVTLDSIRLRWPLVRDRLIAAAEPDPELRSFVQAVNRLVDLVG